MQRSFPAGGSGNSLRWAIALALLIDVPFVVIIFCLGKSEPAILLTVILPLGISALIIYSSYASSKMQYTLDEDVFRINFPLSPLRLSYTKIKGAGKVETSLGFRLFGGSLPGSHWGRFTTSNLGSVQVYATKYKGEFVLLELTDGEKILLSPAEPEVLLEVLRGKTLVGAPTMMEVEEPRLDIRLTTAQIVIVTLTWITFTLYVASVYPGLPEVIPVHFGLNGVPNRYGSKVEMLWLVGLSALFPTMNAVFALKFGKYNKRMTNFLGIIFLLAIGLFALVVNQILSTI